MAIVQPTEDRDQFRKRIIDAVTEMYAEVAKQPEKGFHFPTGRWACERLGYPPDRLDELPVSAVESFAGVGYPFAAKVIRSGDRVLDIGSGSGTDLCMSAILCGENGFAAGLDMTSQMIKKARDVAERAGLANIEIKQGEAEHLPWDDEMFDVITSNGVVNLVPDKRMVFSEMHRVLREGGHIQISDIILKNDISEQCRMNPELWAECIVGASPEAYYMEMIREAGFEDVCFIERYDYFAESPSESTRKSARQFGAESITLTAVKRSRV